VHSPLVQEILAISQRSAAGVEWLDETIVSEGLRKTLLATASTVPTESEDLFGYAALESLCPQIRSAAANLKLKFAREPVFASLPAGDVNAMWVRSPSGQDLVLLNRGLFIFLMLLGKIAATFLLTGNSTAGRLDLGGNDVVSHVASNQDGLQRLKEVLMSQVLFGTPTFAPQYYPPLRIAQLATPLFTSAELFVVGHEYAHAMRSGKVQEQTTRRRLFGEVDADAIMRSKKEEIMADGYGLLLMLKAMVARRFDVLLSFAGTELLFSGVDILQDILQLDTRDSHPPSSVRRAGLRMALKLAVSGQDDTAQGTELAERAIKLASVLEEAFRAAWAEVKPGFLDEMAALRNTAFGKSEAG